MEKHQADESASSILLHVVMPTLITVLIFVVSIFADLHDSSSNWTQRAGNFLIVAGAYIGYHETKYAVRFIDDDLYLNPEIWYKFLSLALVISGTVVSAYGDLLVRLI